MQAFPLFQLLCIVRTWTEYNAATSLVSWPFNLPFLDIASNESNKDLACSPLTSFSFNPPLSSSLRILIICLDILNIPFNNCSLPSLRILVLVPHLDQYNPFLFHFDGLYDLLNPIEMSYVAQRQTLSLAITIIDLMEI
jgi:hypothetical protein